MDSEIARASSGSKACAVCLNGWLRQDSGSSFAGRLSSTGSNRVMCINSLLNHMAIMGCQGQCMRWCMPAEPSTAPTTLTSRLHITRCSTEEGERICCTRCGRRRIITQPQATAARSAKVSHRVWSSGLPESHSASAMATAAAVQPCLWL